jgi:hypothetical protein
MKLVKVLEHNKEQCGLMFRHFLMLVLVFGFSGRTMLAQDARVEACRQLMTNTAPSDAVMRILEPAGDVTIYGNELTVRVALPLNDPKIDHWHLWSNGQLQLMIYGTATTIELPPGTHEICAILGHTDHADVGTPDVLTVTMIEAAEGTPTTSPSEIALQSAAASTTVVEEGRQRLRRRSVGGLWGHAFPNPGNSMSGGRCYASPQIS